MIIGVNVTSILVYFSNDCDRTGNMDVRYDIMGSRFTLSYSRTIECYVLMTELRHVTRETDWTSTMSRLIYRHTHYTASLLMTLRA